MEENSNFDAFYPFFIIIAVYLVTFFKKRAKMKREEEEKRKMPLIRREAPRRAATPPPPLRPVKILKPPTQQNTAPIARKRRPRIFNLVQGLKSKKELVLLSEILSINPYVK